MEIGRQYTPSEWDDVSDVPLFHMSYLVHLLLPLRHLGQERLQVDKEKLLGGFEKNKSQFSDELHVVPVGSKAEGYGIPDAIRLTDPPYFEYMSDIDAMYVRDGFCAALCEFNELGVRNKICLETDSVHPGYARVRYTDPKDTKSGLLFNDSSAGKYYLMSSAMSEGRMNLLTTDQTEDDKLLYYNQGPALTCADPEPMTIKRSLSDKIILPQDSVTAISCDAWPTEALEWTTRQRKNAWLTQGIIDSVVSGGFHIVPVAHSLSANPNIEWRVSFAKAEQQIAEGSVTASQRQCYIYLKILRFQIMKDVTNLSSYSLKNVFLSCCETLPVLAWEDDPAGCIFYMIDVLIECISNGNLPSFFLKENNLIDHLGDVELKHILSLLQAMRSDPITPILEFTDCRIPFFSSADCISTSCTFRIIVKALIDSMETVESVDYEGSIMGCFTDVQCSIASLAIVERRSSFLYHLDFYNTFVNKYIHMSLVDYVNYLGTKFNSPELTLSFYEQCLPKIQEFPGVDFIKGNIACMYFVLMKSPGIIMRDRQTRSNQADKYFTEVLRNKGVHFAATIDYGNFLVSTERQEQARSLFERFILAEKEEPSGMMTCYYTTEAVILNEQLQNEINQTGNLLANSLSFAYYFLIKLSLDTPEATQSVELFREFYNYAHSLQNYGDYTLLGYSGLDIDAYDEAETAFKKAALLRNESDLVQDKLTVCRKKRISHKRRAVLKMAFKYGLVMANMITNNSAPNWNIF